MIAPVFVAALGNGNDTVAVIQRALHPRSGLAMECAAHLDVMKLEELIESESYARGADLLERIVAMLTRLIDP